MKEGRTRDTSRDAYLGYLSPETTPTSLHPDTSEDPELQGVELLCIDNGLLELESWSPSH